MIAITGASSPKGKALILALSQRGKTMRILGSNQGQISSNVKQIDGGVMDVMALDELMDGVDQVYHLDVMDTFHPSSLKQMYRYNIEGTANVVNAALNKGVKKVLFASSILSLGDKATDGVYDEGAKWNNMKSARGYGWSLHLAEREMWRGSSEGLKTLIVHAGNIIGTPTDETTSSQLLNFLISMNGDYPTGNYHPLDVNDLVAVMIQLMESKIANEQFIACQPSIPYEQLAARISSTDQRKGEQVSEAALNRRAFWNWFNLSPSQRGINRAMARVLSYHLTFSNKKISQLLSSDFIDMNESIDRFMNLERSRENGTVIDG